MKTPKNKSQNKVKISIISGVLVLIIGTVITPVASAVTSVIQDIFFPPAPPKWQVLHVVDKDTGKGIENVNVEMAANNAPPSSRKTDHSGYATIQIDSDNSVFTINIEKEKYKSLTKDVLIDKSSPLTTQEFQLEKIKTIIRDPIVEEEGADDKGRKARFTFKLILHDYSWEYSKVDKLKNTLSNTVVDAESEILKELNQSGKAKYIKNAIHLIAVGMSSCEGNRKTEVTRAEQRSTVIQHALSSLSRGC